MSLSTKQKEKEKTFFFPVVRDSNFSLCIILILRESCVFKIMKQTKKWKKENKAKERTEKKIFTKKLFTGYFRIIDHRWISKNKNKK